MWAGALYPGLGEQRRRPCLRLQQAGVTAFHPASSGASYVSVALSMRPSFARGPPPACAGHLALCCLDFPLRSSVTGPERPSFLQARKVYNRSPPWRRPTDTNHADPTTLFDAVATQRGQTAFWTTDPVVQPTV